MPQQEPSYWLMKSEPYAYSIDTLKNDGVTLWDGIRNYQARNFMRNMKKGDKVFFYHSNCKPPGIVGLMEVIDLNIVDPTQFDKDSKYFDPKSKPDNPRWDCVKVKYVCKSNQILSLPELKILFNDLITPYRQYYFLNRNFLRVIMFDKLNKTLWIKLTFEKS